MPTPRTETGPDPITRTPPVRAGRTRAPWRADAEPQPSARTPTKELSSAHGAMTRPHRTPAERRRRDALGGRPTIDAAVTSALKPTRRTASPTAPWRADSEPQPSAMTPTAAGRRPTTPRRAGAAWGRRRRELQRRPGRPGKGRGQLPNRGGQAPPGTAELTRGERRQDGRAHSRRSRGRRGQSPRSRGRRGQSRRSLRYVTRWGRAASWPSRATLFSS